MDPILIDNILQTGEIFTFGKAKNCAIYEYFLAVSTF